MSEDVIHHIMGVPQETDINFLQHNGGTALLSAAHGHHE
jgi:hypothetical protein